MLLNLFNPTVYHILASLHPADDLYSSRLPVDRISLSLPEFSRQITRSLLSCSLVCVLSFCTVEILTPFWLCMPPSPSIFRQKERFSRKFNFRLLLGLGSADILKDDETNFLFGDENSNDENFAELFSIPLG